MEEKKSRNIKLVYSYDGSRYFGFQRQPKKITIQGEIEKILKTVTKEEINLISSGRTDRGVHAKQQVSNFYTFSKIPVKKILYILNNSLPDDIYMQEVEEVDEKFNSRFDAKEREYEYIISWEKNPFESNYVKYVKEKIYIDKLKKIFTPFVGIRDFKNFKVNDPATKTTIREILSIDIEYLGSSKLKIIIRGRSFLKSQIRIMVGMALEVYKGNLSEDYIENMLQDFSKGYKKLLVEPTGLYLSKIIY